MEKRADPGMDGAGVVTAAGGLGWSCLNKEVKRRADVVGIFPNEDSIMRLVGAVLMEQNDDWQTQNRYMQIEGFAEPVDKTPDLKPLQITPKAA